REQPTGRGIGTQTGRFLGERGVESAHLALDATHPLAGLRRDLDEESHPRVQGLLRRCRGISTGSAEPLDVLALARADLDGDREKTGTHHSSALEDRVDERPTGAPVAVLEGVDGLEL